MTGCRYPEHHARTRGGVGLAAVIVAAAVAWSQRRLIIEVLTWSALAVAAGVVIALVVIVVRLCGRHRTSRRPGWLRHVPRALWAAVRWHHLARNLGLAYADKHRTGRVRHPRAVILPGPHGITARVRTVPGTGRAELDAAAEHIANAWRCQRVSVSQPRPGRLVVAGLRRDPLLEQFGLELAPPAVSVRRLWLGRDEHGTDRFADLANVPGIVVGGMPGAGKSTELAAWLTQLAPSPAVQFVNIDGKGAGEFADFEPRAWLSEGDNLDGALDKLETVHSLMLDRLAVVRSALGVKNAWHVGPSEAWPLVMTTIDECQSFLDLTMVKGDKQLEPKVRRAVYLTSSLIRRGRSVMFLTVAATQKPTTDSLPSAIRDNCPISLCFGVKTIDAAAATLGTEIRRYESYSPVTLADPAYAGCCTVTLKTGQDPFTRLRGPYVTEDQAAAAAQASAGLRRDPRDVLPVYVPDSPAALASVPA